MTKEGSARRLPWWGQLLAGWKSGWKILGTLAAILVGALGVWAFPNWIEAEAQKATDAKLQSADTLARLAQQPELLREVARWLRPSVVFEFPNGSERAAILADDGACAIIRCDEITMRKILVEGLGDPVQLTEITINPYPTRVIERTPIPYSLDRGAVDTDESQPGGLEWRFRLQGWPTISIPSKRHVKGRDRYRLDLSPVLPYVAP
ncbi:MAG TPA: hypothetical protein VMT85_14850 [Thermoanaerobaculia bacterium]|nr:hypothetical protein [Thermoanaerobaculia bacterium]